MSKLMKFIFFNFFVYIIYYMIDKLFTFLDFYSNAQLGHDMMVMPTTSDIWLIVFNSIISSAAAFYLLYKMEQQI